jgi:hypothetical protein
LTVLNSRAVSKSQMILPLPVAYARKWPSTEPEKTAPGIPLPPTIAPGYTRASAASRWRGPPDAFAVVDPEREHAAALVGIQLIFAVPGAGQLWLPEIDVG